MKFCKCQLQLRCCKIWKCKCKFAKNLKWNAFEIHWKLHREKVFDSNEKKLCISKKIPQGMLGVHMCAQSTKDVVKWNLVVTSPNWLESIAKKKKEKKRKKKKDTKR